ncbi:hypothetical protein ACRALDRAFT_1070771 [Sodiomyces alcalophilus JCM 7366]|uniref:uncharacterized protein n=1 Tax=Sodiomyces alcalophilus JCM 7366 TaxID=591952 RepID=UPI0039B45351
MWGLLSYRIVVVYTTSYNRVMPISIPSQNQIPASSARILFHGRESGIKVHAFQEDKAQGPRLNVRLPVGRPQETKDISWFRYSDFSGWPKLSTTLNCGVNMSGYLRKYSHCPANPQLNALLYSICTPSCCCPICHYTTVSLSPHRLQ